MFRILPTFMIINSWAHKLSVWPCLIVSAGVHYCMSFLIFFSVGYPNNLSSRITQGKNNYKIKNAVLRLQIFKTMKKLRTTLLKRNFHHIIVVPHTAPPRSLNDRLRNGIPRTGLPTVTLKFLAQEILQLTLAGEMQSPDWNTHIPHDMVNHN